MLTIRQVMNLALLAAALWVLATLNIRLMPTSLTDPVAATILYVVAVPCGWLSVWLAKRLGRLSWDQVPTGVAVVGAVAMMMDGAALRWFPALYSSNDTAVRLGAAWLLWGYGVAFGIAVLMAARAGRMASAL